MDNCEPLALYGALVIILAGGFILVPFLRGKADLISAFNILWLGIAIFIGVGCFEAASTPMRFPGLQWFAPTKAEVSRYMSITTVFLIALIVSYYYDPISRSLSRRSLNKWPPFTTGTALYVIALCVVIVIAYAVGQLVRITFVGQILINVSHKAMVFACCFSFLLWYRQRLNFAWLALFIAVFLGMCMMAMLAAHGRRLLLSVFAVPIVAVYYYHARNWRPTRTLALICVAGLAVFVFNLMYSAIRHYDWAKGEQRTAAGIVKQIGAIGRTDWYSRFARDSLFHFSQQVVHYALLTDHYVNSGQLEPRPFNTLLFFPSYPIPRRIWPDKPDVLGAIITRDVVRATTNWGTSVAGHAAFEGGMIIAVLFGYMAAFGARMFDNPLRRQPKNPFLIAMLATASAHILAWPRGDVTIMTLEIGECFFFAIAMGIGGRIFFGTEQPSQLPAPDNARMRLVYRAAAR
jgi:hypothetical protein